MIWVVQSNIIAISLIPAHITHKLLFIQIIRTLHAPTVNPCLAYFAKHIRQVRIHRTPAYALFWPQARIRVQGVSFYVEQCPAKVDNFPSILQIFVLWVRNHWTLSHQWLNEYVLILARWEYFGNGKVWLEGVILSWKIPFSEQPLDL